ncbi:MAG: hypothetical protein M3Z08_16085 [Chloroflexota bacterium]|nr:hypothetical protein [Chloroflexota bacterium]
MNRSPSRTTRILFCLGTVAFFLLGIILLSLLVIGVFSGRIPVGPLEAVFGSIMAPVFLFSRIKKFRERRRNGRQITWYTQPGMLFALAWLLAIPGFIINLVATNDTLDIVALVTFIPSILLVLVAIFFLIKWLMNPFAD